MNNESTVLELKLPPFTEAAIFRSRRMLLQSIDDLFKFADAHSNEVHFAGNQLAFDNAADSKVAADLVNKFLAAGRAEQ
jgi:hypothetical protein